MAELKYWLWLTQRKGLEGRRRTELLERLGSPESIYFADEEEYRLLGVSERAIQALKDKSMDGVNRILGDCDRLGIHIMTQQDAGYPERLLAIHQPPEVLYWKGREIAFDDEAAVAIVGARDATPYGLEVANQLALDLTRAGVLVLSGMAQGIDAAAVRAALRAGGPVISVLGNGLDVIYPRQNRDLYEDVAAAGMLISEFPPGTEPKGMNFPMRNRVISGLSVGVVVVESRRDGGGLITANHALEQGREVFAVPGPIGSPFSVGTNRLIQEGAAKLILSAEDVVCEFLDRFPDKLGKRLPMDEDERKQRLAVPSGREEPEKPVEPAEEKVVDNQSEQDYIDWKNWANQLTDDQRQVMLALTEGTRNVDDLVEKTQIPARRVLSALTILQIRGLAAEAGGNRFRAAVRLKME